MARGAETAAGGGGLRSSPPSLDRPSEPFAKGKLEPSTKELESFTKEELAMFADTRPCPTAAAGEAQAKAGSHLEPLATGQRFEWPTPQDGNRLRAHNLLPS